MNSLVIGHMDSGDYGNGIFRTNILSFHSKGEKHVSMAVSPKVLVFLESILHHYLHEQQW